MKNPVLLKLSVTLTIIFWSGFAFSQPVIRVAGSKDNQMIKQQVELFLDHLGVQENLYLTIVFSTKLPDKLKGYTVSDPSLEPDKYQNFRVMIDAKLDRGKQMVVLAHEMIHVKQYAKNELKILNDNRVLWKEREYFASPGPNRFMPWEDEAYHADLTLVRQVKSTKKQMQEILAEKAPIQISKTSSRCNYLSEKCTGKILNEPLAKENPDS